MLLCVTMTTEAYRRFGSLKKNPSSTQLLWPACTPRSRYSSRQNDRTKGEAEHRHTLWKKGGHESGVHAGILLFGPPV